MEVTKVGGKLLRRLGVKAGQAVIEFVKSMVENPAAPMGTPKPVQKRSVERREVRAPRQHRRIVVIIGVPVLRGLKRVLDLATIAKVKVRRLLRELELSSALLAYQPQPQPQRQRYD